MYNVHMYLFTTMVDSLGKERCESDILLVGCGPSLEARGRNDVDQLGSIVSVAEDRLAHARQVVLDGPVLNASWVWGESG